MTLLKRDTQKSVRVVLPLSLYREFKNKCLDYGDLSRVVRYLLREWLKNPKASIRSIYDAEEAERDEQQVEAKSK